MSLWWEIFRARIAHMLIESNKDSSVLDIALSCGFEMLNTFHRAYRRVFGKITIFDNEIIKIEWTILLFCLIMKEQN